MFHTTQSTQTLDASFRRGRGAAREAVDAPAALPVSLDSDACATISCAVPLVTPGEAVSHAWPLVSRPQVPTLPTRVHHSDTSADAPFALATTSRHRPYVPSLTPEAYLTHEKRHREVGRRRGEDAARHVSADAPEWVSGDGSRRAAPRLTAPFATYRAGAANRVLLAPLVEVDPFTGRAPAPLPKPGAGPGYIPRADEAARVAAADAAAGRNRLGVTYAAEVGAGESGMLLGRPSAMRAPCDRLGATASALVGAGAAGVAVDAGTMAAGDTARAAAGASRTPHAALFVAEPPYSSYFSRRRDELGVPPLGETALRASWAGHGPDALRDTRAIPTGRQGRAAFDAEAMRAGSVPAQHLGVSMR